MSILYAPQTNASRFAAMTAARKAFARSDLFRRRATTLQAEASASAIAPRAAIVEAAKIARRSQD